MTQSVSFLSRAPPEPEADSSSRRGQRSGATISGSGSGSDQGQRQRTAAAAANSGSGSGSERHPASEHADVSRSPGRAGFDIVPPRQFRLHSTLRTMSNRATPAVHRPGAAAQVTRQAAGAPSARLQSINPPARDRADGATLGRPRHQPRRTRRPALRDATPRHATSLPPPDISAASRTRDACRHNSEGGASPTLLPDAPGRL